MAQHLSDQESDACGSRHPSPSHSSRSCWSRPPSSNKRAKTAF